MKIRSKFGVFLVLACLLMLAGCSRGQGSSRAMGRYVETNEPLPDHDKSCLYGKLRMNEDQKLEVYYQSYVSVLNSDGTYDTTELPWLAKITEEMGVSNYLYEKGKDGKDYVMLSGGIDDEDKAHLYRHSQEGTTEEVKVDAFDEYSMFGDMKQYRTPDRIAVDENGNILLGFYGTILCCDPKGKELYEISDVIGSDMAVSNTAVYVLNNTGDKVESYDLTNGKRLKSVDVTIQGYDRASYGMIKLYVTDSEQIYYVDYAGIHKLSEGGNLWETVVDGTLNSLYSTYNTPQEMCMDAKGNFYVLIRDQDWHPTLLSYHYDAKVPTVPEIELTVYSLFEKRDIVQAIVEFQKENPEVRVNYHIAIPDGNEYDDGVDTSDYIRILNTELMAGNGDDIIIADGLNIDSLIEKNVLEDISDVISPMIEQGDIYQPAAHSFNREGKIYAVPIRISLPIAGGDPEAVKAAASLSGLAEYAKTLGSDSLSLLGTMDYYSLSTAIYDAYGEELFDEKKEISRDRIQTFLENLKEIADKSECQEDCNGDDTSGIFAVYCKEAILGIEDCNDVYMPCIAIKEVNQSDAIAGKFFPKVVTGINHASKNKETAKRFLQRLLSENQQEFDYGGGIGVNPACFDTLLKRDKDELIMSWGYMIHGEQMMYQFRTPSEEVTAQYERMLQNLNHPVIINSSIRKKVVEQSIGFLSQESTLEETTQNILDFMQTYTQE